MTGALPHATLERMLRRVEPGWRLEDAEPVESGFSAVYRLDVAGGGVETCYLKCTTEGDGEGVSADARVQRLLEVETDVPVTPVLGVVDEDADLPAPFHLTAAVPGETLPYEAVGRLSDDTMRGITRDVGRHLGGLHALDAVDSFGYVASGGPSLDGARPVGTPADLTTVRGRKTWPEYLRARTRAELDRHADSRFAGLTDDLRSWFETQIEALSGPFRPALGRNDHGFHNLLVDSEAGRVTAQPDWAYTLAVPPAFDVEFAVFLYGGSFLAGLPGSRDRRPLVREALLAGYEETAPECAERVREPTPCYELLAATRVMNDFGHLDLPEGTKRGVRERFRTDVASVLVGQS
jgi:aminoglycoside phosphotransferase (APT) family kinase protein